MYCDTIDAGGRKLVAKLRPVYNIDLFHKFQKGKTLKILYRDSGYFLFFQCNMK